ncbi:lymphocyte antigen 6 family member pge [Paramormyrops kingsleyae]|nr:prostate stem cell antigen-like [Paramormyrops kingsleyae]
MQAVHLCLFCILLAAHSEALKCYTCVGSTEEECNRQGSRSCPGYSDACAIIRGTSSSVMKTCSYKTFCNQAISHGYRAPEVKVHCCFTDNCNAVGGASTLVGGACYLLILLPALFFLLQI